MREMKDSGIPWIGEIPKDWSVKKLKFSCKLFGRIGFRGYTADDLVEESEGAITLSPTNMNSFNLDFTKCSYLSWDKYYESPEIMVEVGDVLLVKTASVGKCSYVDYLPKETTINPQILVLKEHKDCSKFIAYLFQTSIGEAYIDTTKGGSTIYTISQEKIGNYEFAFPSLAEQQRIAEFLDRKCAEVDEMIDLQEQIIEELKTYKQSVITEAVTKGLNPDVPMRDSGIEWIGQIPEHWGVCRVKDCLLNTKNNLRVGPFGSALSGNDICDTGEYWIYNQRTVLDGNFSTNNSFVTKEKYKELESFRVFPNDILITTRGSIGKIAIVPSDAPIGILHPCIIRFVIDESRYISRLLKRIFNESDFVLKQLRYQSNSTTIEVIYSYTLRNITLPNIPITEQQAIANYLDEKCADIDSLIQTKQKKIDSLKEYKKSIIYEYVTGKREVNE